MNYIFLDVDGVLNSTKYMIKMMKKYDKKKAEMHVDKKAVKRLAKIVRQNKAKIILSSTWRMAFRHDNLMDIHKEIRLLLKYFEKYKIEMIGYTEINNDDRGLQILNYAKQFNKEDRFIVIDDEISNIVKYIPLYKIIQTNTAIGLKRKHIKLCRASFAYQGTLYEN